MYCIWEIFSSIRGRDLVRSVFGGSSLVFEGNSRKYRAGAYLRSISCAPLVPGCDGMVGQSHNWDDDGDGDVDEGDAGDDDYDGRL